MLASTSQIELEPITDDIIVILKDAMGCLDSLHRKEGSSADLKKASRLLAKLKGIFTLLNMPGALALISETNTALSYLNRLKSGSKLAQIYIAIGDALAILSRYIEYISQKITSEPHLLLSTINRLRKINNMPPYKESVFFVLPARILKLDLNDITVDNSDFGASVMDLNLRKIRHLRQMFQVGLIEVIRRANLKGGFKMMRQSVLRVHADFNGHSIPDMWIIAQSMLEGYLTGGMTINNERIKILSRVDRQFRLIEVSDPEKSQSESNRTLVGEMLYLVSLSHSKEHYTATLIKKYELYNNRVDDCNFQHDISVLSGPTPKDLRSLGEEILEEFIRVESILNKLAKQSDGEIAELLALVETLSSLLMAVQLKEESLKLSLVTAILQKAILQAKPISRSDLNISLNLIQKLRALFEQNDLSTLSPTTKVGRNQLTTEQQAACHVSSSHIAKAVQLFDYYYKENKKSEGLISVVEALTSAKSGMKALELNKLIGITNSCIALVQAIISGKYLEKDRGITAPFLADAIGSIEFYMETISKHRTPSPRVLIFARESINELKSLAD